MKAKKLSSSASGTAGELQAAAAITRGGFFVLKPYWGDDEKDLIVLVPWTYRCAVIPVQSKSCQTSDNAVKKLKKRYLTKRAELVLFAYRPDKHLAWLIPGSQNVISYYGDQVKAVRALKRRGARRQKFASIGPDGFVPVRFHPKKGKDPASDAWLISQTDAIPISQQFPKLRDLIDDRRAKKWRGKVPVKVTLDRKPPTVKRPAKPSVHGRGVRRVHALIRAWQEPNAVLSVANLLVRCNFKVALPLVPGVDANLFVIAESGKELLPLRIYVRTAQRAPKSNIAYVDIADIRACKDPLACLAIYSPERDKVWFLPTTERIIGSSKGQAGQVIEVDLSQQGDPAFNARWEIAEIQQLRRWVNQLIALMIYNEKLMYAMRVPFGGSRRRRRK